MSLKNQPLFNVPVFEVHACFVLVRVSVIHCYKKHHILDCSFFLIRKIFFFYKRDKRHAFSLDLL